jgi:hypothetical protein
LHLVPAPDGYGLRNGGRVQQRSGRDDGRRGCPLSDTFPDESGRWLEVEFCRRCGTNLGFTLEAVPGVRTLPAGAFDDPTWITAERYKFRHVFLRSRRDGRTSRLTSSSTSGTSARSAQSLSRPP